MRKNKIIAGISAVLMAAAYVAVPGISSTETVKEASAAEAAYGVLYGDIDNDGNVDVTDLTALSLHIVGDRTICGKYALERADVLYDGEVDIADLAALRQYISKKIDVIGKTPSAVADMVSVRRVGDRIGADGYMEFVCNSLDDVLLETVDKNGANNPVYSPLSFYSALAMSAECANGSTQDEILNVLCADSIDDLNSEYKALENKFNFKDEQSLCLSRNSVWLNDAFKFEADGIDKLKSEFSAAVFEKDYSESEKEKTEKEISDWIYENTENQIKPSIKLGKQDEEMFRLINTIAYENVWINKFSDPYEDTFHKADGNTVKCDFMKYSDSHEDIGFGENYMVYKKAMTNGNYMHFVLPDEGYSAADILSDDAVVTEIFGEKYNTFTRKMELTVPVFEVASKYDLVETAKKLGITEAFWLTGGDFSPVVDPVKNHLKGRGPRISAIDQETVLKIDSKGSKAASYTQVVYVTPMAAAAPGGETVKFRLDRPFFYYITDGNGIPVFTGIIGDPCEK